MHIIFNIMHSQIHLMFTRKYCLYVSICVHVCMHVHVCEFCAHKPELCSQGSNAYVCMFVCMCVYFVFTNPYVHMELRLVHVYVCIHVCVFCVHKPILCSHEIKVRSCVCICMRVCVFCVHKLILCSHGIIRLVYVCMCVYYVFTDSYYVHMEL